MNKSVIIGIGLITIAVILIRKANKPAVVTKETSSASGCGCGH